MEIMGNLRHLGLISPSCRLYEPEAGGRNFQGIWAMEEDPDESILLSISRPIT